MRITRAASSPAGAYVPLSRTVAGKALSADVTLVKGDVGLGNVDNTADASKPVSTAQATADTAVQTAAAADVTSRAALKANNLSDLASASAARTNLGLATVAATGLYSDLTGAPTQTTVTKRGAYTATSGDFVLADTASRAVTDAATTSGSATLTSATAAFVAGDVGRSVTGTGIPANTTISAVGSGTSITLSANATATATGVTVTFGGGFTVTLPAASTTARVSVKKTDATPNTVTISPPSGTVDGATSLALTAPGGSRDFVSDGTNWLVG